MVRVSLDEVRRPGWEAAYIDKENLNLFLEELEKCRVALEELKKQEEDSKKDPSGHKTSLELRDQGGRYSVEEDAERQISDENTSLISEYGLGSSYTDERPEADLYDDIEGGDGDLNGDNTKSKIDLSTLSRQEVEFRARDLSQKCLTLLRREVERISLFATSRKGELADATGSLRFNAFLDNDETQDYDTTKGGPVSMNMSPQKSKFLTIRHDSVNVGGDRGINSKPKYHTSLTTDDVDGGEEDTECKEKIDNSDGDDLAEELSFLLPQMANTMHEYNSSLRFRESLEINPRPMFTGAAVLKIKEYHNTRVQAEEEVEEPWEEKYVIRGKEESSSKSNLDPYTMVAVELLHLLRFICVNAIEVRKILNRYDIIMAKYPTRTGLKASSLRRELDKMRPFLSSLSTHSSGLETSADLHLQQLTNSNAIAAITSSLLKASLNTGSMNVSSVEKFLIHDEALLRFKCAVDCIDILKEYTTTVVRSPFTSYLSRRSLTVTGYELGGMEGKMQRALEVLLTLDPDVILKMDKLDLAEWQQRCWNYTFTDAGDKMRQTSFDFLKDDDHYHHNPSSGSSSKASSWGGVNSASLYINFMSMFLYTMNYYVIAPTANTYAMHLGIKGAYGSVIIGASSASAFVAAFMYTILYNALPIKSALLFSSLFPLVGNLVYCSALYQQSVKMALLGRILIGFGSAEVVNRQLISSCVHFNHITRASVEFAIASVAGIAAGPLVGGLLDFFTGRDFTVDFDLPYVGVVIVSNISIPGFVMSALWFIQCILVIFFFREPFRVNSSYHNSYTEEEAKIRRASFLSELKLVSDLVYRNPTLPLTLFLLSYVEMMREIVVSSCSMISLQYFGWNGSITGFLVALLGFCVLPTHYVVEFLSRIFGERGFMKFSIILIALSLCSMINYETLEYDIKTLSLKSWDEIQTGERYVHDTSVNTYNTVENATINDWDTLKDPQTWKSLLNDTEIELERLENATELEWQHFTNKTEQEWKTLSKDVKKEYENLANATQQEWEELNEETQSHWNNLINESKNEWGTLTHSASSEWKKIPNQTTEGWQQIEDEFKRLPNQTENEWDKVVNGTGNGWHKIVDGTVKQWGRVRDGTLSLFDGKSNSTEAQIDKDGNLVHHNLRRRRIQSVSIKPYDWSYGRYVYIVGSFAIFISLTMLDGVNTSTMCKSAPSKLNNTFINVGLLATLFGSFGRMTGDALIAFFAVIDRTDYFDFVNRTFLPLVPITLYGYFIVRKHYSSQS